MLCELLTNTHALSKESARRLRVWGGPTVSTALLVYLRMQHENVADARLKHIEEIMMLERERLKTTTTTRNEGV